MKRREKSGELTKGVVVGDREGNGARGGDRKRERGCDRKGAVDIRLGTVLVLVIPGAIQR